MMPTNPATPTQHRASSMDKGLLRIGKQFVAMCLMRKAFAIALAILVLACLLSIRQSFEIILAARPA